MKTSRLILTKISDGLFPTEKTVYFRAVDGEVSVFVSTNQIDNDHLKVILLDQDANHALVQVPSQGGMTVAKVNRGEIITNHDDSFERQHP
jgi:hypothetical protein